MDRIPHLRLYAIRPMRCARTTWRALRRRRAAPATQPLPKKRGKKKVSGTNAPDLSTHGYAAVYTLH
jgi:hypothetical protein